MIDKMIDYYNAALFVAIAGGIIACYTDIKTKEIPNSLTFSMIFIGLLFFLLNFYHEWILFIPLAISYLLIWLLWRAGLWGGGDAKLVMGMIALISPFYGMEFIPSFFMMIALSSFLHYSIFGLIEAVKEKKGKTFVMIMAMMIFFPTLFYFLLRSISREIAIVAALITLFISGDIASSFLPCRRKVKVSDKIVGEVLAEIIYVKNGKIFRMEKEPSFIISIIKRIKRKRTEGMEILIQPRYTGISGEEVKILRKCCNDVSIFISYPMAPLVLVAFFLSFLFGKEIFSMIMEI